MGPGVAARTFKRKLATPLFSRAATPGCGLTVIPVIIRKDHGQMLIEIAQHSYLDSMYVLSGMPFKV